MLNIKKYCDAVADQGLANFHCPLFVYIRYNFFVMGVGTWRSDEVAEMFCFILECLGQGTILLGGVCR